MKKILQNKGYECVKDGVKMTLVNSPEVTQALNKRKTIKKAVLYSILSALIFTFFLNILVLPLTGNYARVEDITSYNGTNPYIVFDKQAMVSAHRAGGDLWPEETMSAFKHCLVSEKVDILEFDLHLSKDNELVLLHDHALDRTSDSVLKYGKNVKVKDLTIDQLKTLNMGYNFVKDGKYPYRTEGADLSEVRILTIDEILTFTENYTFTNPSKKLNYIIEIKDGGSRGEKSMDALYKAMVKHNIVERTVVGTFQQNVTDYIDKNYVSVHRSAGIMDTLNLYYSFLYNTKPNNKFDVMQIPMGNATMFNLGSAAFIDYAHKHNIALQYWTINDEADMRMLLANGADAIITDNPDLAYDVIMSL